MTQTRCKLAPGRALRSVLMACALICLQVISPYLIGRTAVAAQPGDGSVLPFPPTPSANKAGSTLQESTHHRRVEPNRLPADAPNILIILIDDVGYGVADTFGGEVHTPTLSHLADEGIRYNAFHTTAICSPTRAALLTGRNHHRVGNGTIAERASDWDGYSGVIPRTSATLAEVLHDYGYKSAAFGKWHNTPANQTTAGPFDRWPRQGPTRRFPLAAGSGHGFTRKTGLVALIQAGVSTGQRPACRSLPPRGWAAKAHGSSSTPRSVKMAPACCMRPAGPQAVRPYSWTGVSLSMNTI